MISVSTAAQKKKQERSKKEARIKMVAKERTERKNKR